MSEESSQQVNQEAGESGGVGAAPGTQVGLMLLPFFVIGAFVAAVLDYDLLTVFGILALGIAAVVMGFVADLIMAALFKGFLWVAEQVESRWSA